MRLLLVCALFAFAASQGLDADYVDGIAMNDFVRASSRFTNLVFYDDFDTFDLSRWQHEITAGGGGNWEFEYYYNNRSNSYVNNSILYLKPTLTADHYGEAFLTTGDLNLWGGVPADQCTANQFYGCERTGGAGGNIVNPIESAAIRTAESFSFMYGKMEVRAQLPRGDWIWPAIWLLPRYNAYGQWPASGEIDLMESRGNSAQTYPNPPGGVNSFGSTLHVGPGYPFDDYLHYHQSYTVPTGDLADQFHIYGLVWTENFLYTYIDNENNVVLNVTFNESAFNRGGWSKMGLNNPWAGRNNSAPFDQPFYLIFNVAVGGTNSYFPDGVGGKPWSNNDPHASNTFWNNKGQWYSTWNGDDVAMKIDYVKVWQ